MNQTFKIRGIPEVLEVRPDTRTNIITHEEVLAIMETNQKAILPVFGDCLEGAQVMDGGWAFVDFTRRPAPPRYKSKGGDGSSDLCLCFAVFPGQKRPMMMLKRYDGVWGPWQMVSTVYKGMWKDGKLRLNCGMEAREILGVVIASWGPDGHLLWKRDPESFPEELGTTPTIHGENIGDPFPIKAVTV